MALYSASGSIVSAFKRAKNIFVNGESPTNRSLLLSFILSNVATVYIHVSATGWEIAIACVIFWKNLFNATLPHPIAATVDIAAPPQRTLRNWKTLKTWNWLPEWNLTSTQHRQSTGMEGGKYLNWATCGTWAETHLKTWEKLRQIANCTDSGGPFEPSQGSNCTPGWLLERGSYYHVEVGSIVVHEKEPDKSSGIGLVSWFLTLLIQGSSTRCTVTTKRFKVLLLQNIV